MVRGGQIPRPFREKAKPDMRQNRTALHSNLASNDIAEYEHRTRHQPRHRAPPAGTALINSGLSSANHLLKRVPVVVRWIFMDSAQSQLLMSLCWRAAQPTETNNVIA